MLLDGAKARVSAGRSARSQVLWCCGRQQSSSPNSSERAGHRGPRNPSKCAPSSELWSHRTLHSLAKPKLSGLAGAPNSCHQY